MQMSANMKASVQDWDKKKEYVKITSPIPGGPAIKNKNW